MHGVAWNQLNRKQPTEASCSLLEDSVRAEATRSFSRAIALIISFTSVLWAVPDCGTKRDATRLRKHESHALVHCRVLFYRIVEAEIQKQRSRDNEVPNAKHIKLKQRKVFRQTEQTVGSHFTPPEITSVYVVKQWDGVQFRICIKVTGCNSFNQSFQNKFW